MPVITRHGKMISRWEVSMRGMRDSPQSSAGMGCRRGWKQPAPERKQWKRSDNKTYVTNSITKLTVRSETQ